jgi:hypothetical protein
MYLLGARAALNAALVEVLARLLGHFGAWAVPLLLFIPLLTTKGKKSKNYPKPDATPQNPPRYQALASIPSIVTFRSTTTQKRRPVT